MFHFRSFTHTGAYFLSGLYDWNHHSHQTSAHKAATPHVDRSTPVLSIISSDFFIHSLIRIGFLIHSLWYFISHLTILAGLIVILDPNKKLSVPRPRFVCAYSQLNSIVSCLLHCVSSLKHQKYRSTIAMRGAVHWSIFIFSCFTIFECPGQSFLRVFIFT